MVLDRSRHRKLIAEVRAAGERIRLIGDGDLSAGISAAVAGTNTHALMGIGGPAAGGPLGAAMKCLYGEKHVRLGLDPESPVGYKAKVLSAGVVFRRPTE